MEKNAYVLNDNAMSHQTQSPRHEGFLFHNLCSWALSLITTDRINLRNQHSFFIFVLFWVFFPSLLGDDSVHHLLLHFFNGRHLLVQSGCTCFNYITHISN